MFKIVHVFSVTCTYSKVSDERNVKIVPIRGGCRIKVHDGTKR
jgi:hypothetical protein